MKKKLGKNKKIFGLRYLEGSKINKVGKTNPPMQVETQGTGQGAYGHYSFDFDAHYI